MDYLPIRDATGFGGFSNRSSHDPPHPSHKCALIRYGSALPSGRPNQNGICIGWCRSSTENPHKKLLRLVFHPAPERDGALFSPINFSTVYASALSHRLGSRVRPIPMPQRAS